MTSGLTHLACFTLCKFNLVVHTKCWKGTFCMDYEAEFTNVKQARKVKPVVTASCIYVTTLSRIDHVISGTGAPQ